MINVQQANYLVEPSKSPQEAIKFAIKNDLFGSLNINKNLVKGYLNSKCYIPIEIIETVCKFNNSYIEIPIIYQNLWFCLNNVKIKRIQHSGRIIKTRVKFTSVYFDSSRTYSLIKEVVNTYGKNYFSKLIGLSEGAIDLWVNKKSKVPLTAVIKACGLLKKDFWNEINNLRIYNKTNDNIIIFRNKYSAELRDILIWIKEEGHLSLSGKIQIEQKDEVLLERIRNLFMKVFSLSKKHTYIGDKGGGIFVLYIYSYAIRQVLCLKFGIPLGYKSKISSYSAFDKLKNKEDKLRTIAKLIETEGSLTYCNKKYNFLQPKFYFGVYNKETISFYNQLLTDLNYQFYTNIRKRRTGISYESAICNLFGAAKLCYEIFPYLYHRKRIKDAIRIFSQSDYIKRLRIKNNDNLKNLIRKAFLIVDPTCKEHVLKLAKMLSEISKKYNFKINKYNIFDWLRTDKRETDIPLIVVLLLCKITNENYFKFIPKELAFLLFIHKFINYNELKNLRGLNYNYILNVMNDG